MQLSQLELTAFRSYPALRIELGAGPQLVVGPNAAGKTNLLEAIALLATGRSHRTSTDAELVEWGAPFGRVEGGLTSESGTQQRIEVVLERTGPTGVRKRIRVNGVGRRASALPEVFRVVTFAPEEMLLVAGGPGLRRASIDALAAQRWPLYERALSTYGRALQQRNGLLRAIRDGLAGRDELHYWDEVVIAEGGTVVSQRLALLGELASPIAEAHRTIAPREGTLTLEYVTNAPAGPTESPGDALRRRLGETADKELWNGITLVGPHRDDLSFALDGRELSTFASRGQQRSAILAFKLAALELLTKIDGRPPLLLLDDVFSELDPARRAHLVDRVASLPQAIVTTTSLGDLDPALTRVATAWQVSPGRVDAVVG